MSSIVSTSGRFTQWIYQTFILTDSSGNWPFFWSFRSSPSGIWPWILPLPLRSLLFPDEIECGQHSRQDWRSSLRISLILDGEPITSKSHTHPSDSQTSRLLTSSLSQFRCFSPPINPVYVRRVNSLGLSFSLPSHRHSYIGLIFSSRFIDS